MGNVWITTHWPTPVTDLPFSRHVYVKEGRVDLPAPGDAVIVREQYKAVVHKKPVKTVIRHHRGERRAFDLPDAGVGGVIGTTTVAGARRAIGPDDVVFDYGDLAEWSAIPCTGFRSASLPLDDLLDLTRMPNARGLNLWRVRDDAMAAELMSRLRA
ncbi:MAG: hypothetical protein AVDCRST_MAG64-1091 [uncultured Phycisphaerae bacterium]|uniref:Uncharacterized protein n=1 Tax=uncultured Phycisphaerae bacterium TaxID=904963 RepID=A0A6J4NLE0_9BACT|nr:MAG: hypothetical protein AVDCRST_MAG64-1091 [uncultured Phycisphaerae bacterium]